MKNTFWSNPSKKKYPSVSENIQCRYLIVGGGIGGVTLAYFLLERGATDIVLLERNEIGGGATGHSAGMLVTEIEGDTLKSLSEKIGQEKANTYWKVQENSLQDIHRIVEREHIDCDMEPERLYIFGRGESGEEEISNDIELRHRMHLFSKSYIGEKVFKEIHTEYYDSAEEVYSGISVNPLKLVQGIADIVSQKGVRVFEHSEVKERNEKNVFVNGYNISFDTVIYAKDAYTESDEMLRYKTTCAVTESLSDDVLQSLNLMEHKMYIENFVSSYHYMKVTKENRLLIGYGDRQVHDVPNEIPLLESHLLNIQKYLRKVFPDINIQIEYAWTGIYGLHKEVLPLVRRVENGYVFGGAGTQVATVAISKLIADLVVGNDNELKHVFEIL
ncbi:MAG: FAD-binding oxidoreductase [Candidatus Taylorbacteria bacterium]|nr:FAD-binding oxidoreductase [Candidatus Taylorbacteria bacterium]